MADELTPWFPASVKPVRSGIYEVNRNDVGHGYPKRTRLQFNAARGKWSHTEESCLGFAGYPADMSGRNKWRGLTKEAE